MNASTAQPAYSRIPPGNIFSGDPLRAAFTNPTELAFSKGCLKDHYPVAYQGETFEDAEAAYQHARQNEPLMDSQGKIHLMADIIFHKLVQHPDLFQMIEESGGEDWIKACSHFTGAHSQWEGQGLESMFIQALLKGYQMARARS